MNWIAIVIAGVANIILGSLWFGPIFGKAWMSATGKTDMSGGQTNMGMMYGITTVSGLVTAATLAYFIGFGTVSLANGVAMGLFAGVGLLATAFLSSGLFLGWPFKLYLISAGYYVVQLVVDGAIIGGMGK